MTLAQVVGGHVAPGAALEALRTALQLGRVLKDVRTESRPFSLMTQNMGLMVAPARYLGTQRSGAITELIKRIKLFKPDVVGLCEVYSDSERDEIRRRLGPPYRNNFRQGPDEARPLSDGGLLLMSRHPIVTSDFIIYRRALIPDALSLKGAIHIRVKPAGATQQRDVFFSHTQDILVPGGVAALTWQLQHLGQFVLSRSSPLRPSYTMGDLNWPADRADLRQRLYMPLDRPVDLWTATHPGLSGLTFMGRNTFYEDRSDAPAKDERLDYILQGRNLARIPTVSGMRVLELKRGKRHISDHFGLLCRLGALQRLVLDLRHPVRRVRARARVLYAFQMTRGGGSDVVSFKVTLRQGATEVSRNTARTEVAERNRRFTIPDHVPAAFSLPQGSLFLRIEGFEHDGRRRNSLGIQQVALTRTELLMNLGRTYPKVLPFIKGQGGRYSVTVDVTVE